MTSNHPAATIEKIIVRPDDIIETFRRNARDRNQTRLHVLRIHPPFDGEKRAKPFVSEDYTFYPPDMDPKPIHLGQNVFVGEDAPSLDYEYQYPEYSRQHGLFREEFGLYDEEGNPTEFTNEQENKWNGWWETAVEEWEYRVRQGLRDEITLTSQYPDIESVTIPVTYEGEK